MTNINTEGLPPEMQQRIAEIIEKAKANAVPPQPTGLVPTMPADVQRPQAPIARPPSLMDHVIALRQEVDQLRQQVAAVGQVSEAVGQCGWADVCKCFNSKPHLQIQAQRIARTSRSR